MRSKSTIACFAVVISLLVGLTGCGSNNTEINESVSSNDVTETVEQSVESNKLQNSGSKNESGSSPISKDNKEKDNYYYVLETNSAVTSENEDAPAIKFKDAYSNYGTPITLDESDINIPLADETITENENSQEELEEKQEEIREELWENNPMVGLPPLDDEYWYEEEDNVEVEYWYNEETGLWETRVIGEAENSNTEESESSEIVEQEPEIKEESAEVKRQRIAYEINKFVYQDIYLNGVSLLDNVKSEEDFNSKHRVTLSYIFSMTKDNLEKLDRVDNAIRTYLPDNQNLIKSWDKLYKELKPYRDTVLSMEKCKEVVSNKDKLKSTALAKVFNNFSNTITAEIGDYSPIPEYKGNIE